MVEKIMAIRRDKCAAAIGRLDDGSLLTLNRMLALVVGVAD
jgi:mRNA interferase MazF